MFFRWKKEYHKLIERLERIRGYNRELYKDNERFLRISSNLESILNNNEVVSTDLYKYNDMIYCIVEKRLILTNSSYEIFYYTYNLSDTLLDPITKLESKVNIGEKNIRIRLDNIDTMSNKREGHASRQIKKLIKYGKDIGATKITGELWKGSPIGGENLRGFYIKNGFDVNDRIFFMNL